MCQTIKFLQRLFYLSVFMHGIIIGHTMTVLLKYIDRLLLHVAINVFTYGT